MATRLTVDNVTDALAVASQVQATLYVKLVEVLKSDKVISDRAVRSLLTELESTSQDCSKNPDKKVQAVGFHLLEVCSQLRQAVTSK